MVQILPRRSMYQGYSETLNLNFSELSSSCPREWNSFHLATHKSA